MADPVAAATGAAKSAFNGVTKALPYLAIGFTALTIIGSAGLSAAFAPAVAGGKAVVSTVTPWVSSAAAKVGALTVA